MTTIALLPPSVAFSFWGFVPDQNNKRRGVVRPSTLSQRPSLSELFLAGEVVPGWEVIQPLALNIQYDEDGSVVVSDKSFYIYGCGETVQAAVYDYAVSLSEYYEILESYDDEPSHSLFNLLRQYLRPL